MAPSSPHALIPSLARLGYAAKGVVYLLVGYVAARAALAAGRPGGSEDALQELLRRGRWMVLVVAIGLAAHVLWRIVQTVRDPEHHDGKMGRRVLYLVSALIYGSLSISAFRLWAGQGGGGTNADGGRELAFGLMRMPMGVTLVALLGMAVVGYAIQQFVVAIRGDFAKRLNIPRADARQFVVVIGRAGTAARAAVLAIVGVFFLQAARQHDPDRAGGTGEVLERFSGNEWLLTAVAAGLIAYGMLQLANALWRRIPVP